jgi:hypothetical protein
MLQKLSEVVKAVIYWVTGLPATELDIFSIVGLLFQVTERQGSGVTSTGNVTDALCNGSLARLAETEQVNEPTCAANVGASNKVKVVGSKFIEGSQTNWWEILPQSANVENAVIVWIVGTPLTELVMGRMMGVVQVGGEHGLTMWSLVDI